VGQQWMYVSSLGLPLAFNCRHFLFQFKRKLFFQTSKLVSASFLKTKNNVGSPIPLVTRNKRATLVSPLQE
jgi:hypothetical protein